jgi:hypothetical protein
VYNLKQFIENAGGSDRRFQGIKGTQSAKAKYLPVENGEAGAKGYGEGIITYTLPSK